MTGVRARFFCPGWAVMGPPRVGIGGNKPECLWDNFSTEFIVGRNCYA